MSVSLYLITNRINHADFFGERIPKEEREKLALIIAERQGKEGSYAGMFAPTPDELKSGIRLFTGEMIRPSASLRHVSGEEVCRAMLLLKPQSKIARAALKSAEKGMTARLAAIRQVRPNNLFCCGTCDPSLWRHITVGGLEGQERWLEIGLRALKGHRKGDGTYYRFPIFFTSLALLEIQLKAAKSEMRYIAPQFESYLKRQSRSDEYSSRRRAVAERLLNLI